MFLIPYYFFFRAFINQCCEFLIGPVKDFIIENQKNYLKS